MAVICDWCGIDNPERATICEGCGTEVKVKKSVKIKNVVAVTQNIDLRKKQITILLTSISLIGLIILFFNS